MLDVKSWLESTEYKVKESRFLKPPPLPYIIFLDARKYRGADRKNLIVERDITIELYSEVVDETAEHKINCLVNTLGVEYEYGRIWIESEKMFQTVYDFHLIEKMEV